MNAINDRLALRRAQAEIIKLNKEIDELKAALASVLEKKPEQFHVFNKGEETQTAADVQPEPTRLYPDNFTVAQLLDTQMPPSCTYSDSEMAKLAEARQRIDEWADHSTDHILKEPIFEPDVWKEDE